MPIPILFHVAGASQVLPVAAVAMVGGRRRPAPYLRIASWCCLLLLFDVIDLFISEGGRSNHWTGYFTVPIEVGMTLWILSVWHPDGRTRRGYAIGIAAMFTGIAAALLFTDPVRSFDVWVSPLAAIVAFGAVLHTLVTLTLRSRAALQGQDWFWICVGLSIFWVVQISTPALMTALMEKDLQLVTRVWLSRAALMIVGYACIAWGIVCPTRLPR